MRDVLDGCAVAVLIKYWGWGWHGVVEGFMLCRACRTGLLGKDWYLLIVLIRDLMAFVSSVQLVTIGTYQELNRMRTNSRRTIRYWACSLCRIRMYGDLGD